MNLEQWKNQAQERLRTIAQTLGKMTPGMTYGALVTSTIYPLLTALQQADTNVAALIAVINFASSLGGNLLAEKIGEWKDLSEADLRKNLAQEAKSDPALREMLDQLLEKAEAPSRIVQAILSEADKDELKASIAESLQKVQMGLNEVGSRLVIEGDFVAGDKVGGHKILTGNISGNIGVAVGTNIVQNVYQNSIPDKTAELRKRYLLRIRNTCGSLPLALLGGDEESGSKVTLDDVYIDLNTQSFEQLPEEITKGDDGQPQIVRRDQRQLRALDVATRNPRMVLLGDPGSGKSTFVQRMVAWVSSAALGEKAPPDGWNINLLPVFTVLRDLAPKLVDAKASDLSETVRDKRLVQTLLQHWQEELAENSCGDFYEAFQDALVAGTIFLVFDGLDEVPQQSRVLVRQMVAALLHRYPAIQRLIITCRIRSYVGSTVLSGWSDHRLAPFSPEQMARFVEGWYNTQYRIGQIRSEKERNDQISDLQQAVGSDALAELAANPMLLTTMALIHQRNVRLPTQRVKLYQLAVENLLQRWQRRKFKVSEHLEKVLTDDRRLRKIVERIAYESLQVRNRVASTTTRNSRRRNHDEDEESGDLGRGELLVLLEDPLYLPESGLPDEFLDYIDQRAGLLIGRGGSDMDAHPQAQERKPLSYRFPHRTFQEYLAGCYLVSLQDVAQEYWNHAELGDGWDLAAQLGGEELYYNSSSGASTLLPTIYHLCPKKTPRSKEEWRRLLWSAQLATLFNRVEIERYKRGEENGPAYIKRLIERLILAVEDKARLSIPDRSAAANVLAKLGDPRPGVVQVANPKQLAISDLAWSDVIGTEPFTMGSDKRKDKHAYDDEQPQFQCKLITQPYRISRYPITVAHYRIFVDGKGYEQEKYWTKAGWQWRAENAEAEPERYRSVFELDNHPQVGVSWYEAVAFCNWLSQSNGLPMNDPLRSIRLPSEAEWERAARGMEGQIYPWKGEWDEKKCNNIYLGLNATSAVGIFPAGNAACGAADMSGNIWEWCSTKWTGNYQDYLKNVDDKLEGSDRRVLRGGSFSFSEYDVRCACRYYHDPFDRDLSIGFRVLLPGSKALVS